MKKHIIFAFLCMVLGLSLKYFMHKPDLTQPTNQLIVGVNGEFAPFTFYRGQQLTGFDIEVIQEIGHRTGKSIVIKDMPFEALLPEIQLQKLDIIIGGVNPTPEREKQVLFSKPLYEGDKLVIISPRDRLLKKLTDLEGETIIVNEGYYADAYVTQHLANANIVRLSTNNTIEALHALVVGKGSAFVASWQTVVPFMSDAQKERFGVILIRDSGEKDAIAVAKDKKDLLIEINRAIESMEEDGTLSRLQLQWLESIQLSLYDKWLIDEELKGLKHND